MSIIKIRVKAVADIWRDDAIVPAGTWGTVECLSPLTVVFDAAATPGRRLDGFRIEGVGRHWLLGLEIQEVAVKTVVAPGDGNRFPDPWTPQPGDYVRRKADPKFIRAVHDYDARRHPDERLALVHPYGGSPTRWTLADFEPWRPVVGETVRGKASGRQYEVAEVESSHVVVKSGRGNYAMPFGDIEPVGDSERRDDATEPPGTRTTKVPAVGQRVRRNCDDQAGVITCVSACLTGDDGHCDVLVRLRFDDGTSVALQHDQVTCVGATPRFITIEEPA